MIDYLLTQREPPCRIESGFGDHDSVLRELTSKNEPVLACTAGLNGWRVLLGSVSQPKPVLRKPP